MSEFIHSLVIKRFRTFPDLRIDNLGKVNLITGKNNSGKSSLLEAIRILATGGSLRTLYNILDYREELRESKSGVLGDTEKNYEPNVVAPFCNLFYGVPDVTSCREGFSIFAEGAIPAALSNISVSIGWFSRKMDQEQSKVSYEPVAADLFDDVDVIPMLEMNLSGRKRIMSLDRDRVFRRTLMDADVVVTPCVYLDPFSSHSTSQLGALWDAIALTEMEQEIVEALRVISSDILAISMIGSNTTTRSRIAIVKSSRFPQPVSLRTFGDGLNRLFGIVLSLCNARNGVLLVDEIENGLHYSVQVAIWRIIFSLAKKLNVQVFATSHSWDCVRAFQEAASESPEKGVLIRLSKRDESVIPTLFSEHELAIAALDQIEVR
jgi:hypothetical protein